MSPYSAASRLFGSVHVRIRTWRCIAAETRHTAQLHRHGWCVGLDREFESGHTVTLPLDKGQGRVGESNIKSGECNI